MFRYIVIILLLFLVCENTSAQVSPKSSRVADIEDKLKSAYLYNMAKYIEWPEMKERLDTFYVGVLGESSVFDELSKIARVKTINGRPMQVYKYGRTNDFKLNGELVPHLNKCHLIYVPEEVEGMSPTLLNKLFQQNILLVGDRPHFAVNGGVIAFIVKRNKLQFEINHYKLLDQSFKVSARLLQLAILVSDEKN